MENRELKIALQDYQNAVELIMSKYRSHTAQLIAASKVDLRQLCSEYPNRVRSYQNGIFDCYIVTKEKLDVKVWLPLFQIIEAQAEKINEMTAVMIEAASFVEEKEVHLEEIITKLKVENKVTNV